MYAGIGIVEETDAEARTARVRLPGLGNALSMPLRVIGIENEISVETRAGAEPEEVSYGGESKRHGHAAWAESIAAQTPWMPAAGSRCLALLLDGGGGAGVVLGGL
jgi:hypothetical protein